MDRQPLTDRLGDRLLAEYGGAAAAYSLRALNGNGDSVVRVRRASDNDEKDFTAEQIELGEMVNWVNSQTVPPLDIGVETSEGRIPVPEGGTSIGTPAAAYSLRNLSTTYTGNVVDVRRSSGGTESFTAAEVADGALTDWVGVGNDGFVSKWYDQSGNDNHATQGTAASQPKIVDGGSLVSGGIDFDGVNDFMQVAIGTITQPISGFSVFKNDSLTFAPSIWDSISATNRVVSYSVATDDTFRISAGTAIISAASAQVDGTNYLRSDFFDSTSSSFYANGTIMASGDAGSNAMEGLTIGARYDGTANFTNGTIAEIIIYPSDQSDNRTAIEANIGETYGITGIPAYDNTVDGFVETWYDQSGNGNDATQSVTASQPKIVDAGVLVAGGLDFDGVDDSLGLTGSGLDIFKDVGYGQVFSVITPDNAGTGIDRYFEATGELSGARFLLGDSQDFSASSRIGGRRLDADGFQDIESSTTHGNSETLITGFLNWADSDAYLYFNETQVASSTSFQTDGNTSDTSSDSIAIGGVGILGDFKVKELIIYNTDQSANRVAIETNINDQYNIY